MTHWGELEAELDRWRDAGRTATLWWRDDDAVDDTRELGVLLETAGDIPLALAVIPAHATPALAARLGVQPTVTVLQHGWRHDNHAPERAPSSEYPPGRDAAKVAREFIDGASRLRALFGARYQPVFAPPWHGFDETYLTLLVEAGISALSRKGPRTAATALGLAFANIHAVPILWSQPPTFGGEAAPLSAITAHLAARREGRADALEPTGILTHHLVQDTPSWAFMRRLRDVTSSHPAARWIDTATIFGSA